MFQEIMRLYVESVPGLFEFLDIGDDALTTLE